MKIFSVSQLTQEIKKQLETSLGSVTVEGEISNLKIQSSGHVYFTLKDKEAQIAAVLFKGSTRGLSRLPKEGDQVVATGEITVYPPRGSYQLLVRELQYQGLGALLAMLHERKNKFQALGYFAKERKKKLPLFPKVIGVVTSPTGAVIQDILNVLQRRHPGFHLILCPVKVQGEGAKEEIAEAIRTFNSYNLADVLIVGRGGGSLEDLWAFNEEVVVQAIFESKIPIISAVGHETDFSLSDFVADVRAPTPSAAAEIVIFEKKEQLKFLLQTEQRLRQHSINLLSHLRRQINSVSKNPYLVSPYLLLSKRLQQLDDMKQKIFGSIQSYLSKKKLEVAAIEKQKKVLEPSQQILAMREKVYSLQKNLTSSVQQVLRNKRNNLDTRLLYKAVHQAFYLNLQRKKEKLEATISHLSSIDPKNLLHKGYCILFSENQDSVILSVDQISASQKLKILLQDGVVNTKVEEIIYDPTRKHPV